MHLKAVGAVAVNEKSAFLISTKDLGVFLSTRADGSAG